MTGEKDPEPEVEELLLVSHNREKQEATRFLEGKRQLKFVESF